ncbi:MAG: clostripain-related cysteine peptidase [Candidatus Eremiobacterota bacterium]
MRILTNSYKSNFPDKTLILHKAYSEKQLEPVLDRVDVKPEPEEKEWTLLFYNAGQGGEAKMCTHNLLDLENVGSDENTNVVVMNYRSTSWLDGSAGFKPEYRGTKTYYVEKNEKPPEKNPSLISNVLSPEAKHILNFTVTGPQDIKSPVLETHASGTNMGDSETLKKFILENIKKFPAKHYAVILSGHGAAFGGTMIVKHPDGRIRNNELGEVFKEVEKEIGKKVDLVNMNSCYSANIESIYPLKDSVDSLVATESSVFAANQPFGTVLKDLQDGIKDGKNISGKDLARLFVEESRMQPLGNLYMETLSAFDMNKIGSLVEHISNLQKVLMSEGVPSEVIKKAIQNSLRFDYSSVPKQIDLPDLGSFLEEITKLVDSEKVKKAAEEVKKSLGECVFAEEHAKHEMESVTSRVFHSLCRPEHDLDRATGLTIYYDHDALHFDSRLDQVEGLLMLPEDIGNKLSGKIDAGKLEHLLGKKFSSGRLTSELLDLKFNKEDIDTILAQATMEKTKYAEDVDVRTFLTYASQATEKEKAERSIFRKTLDAVKDKYNRAKYTLAGNIDIAGLGHVFVNMLEHAAKTAAFITCGAVLGAAGVPVGQVFYGPYIGGKGLKKVASGLKESTELVKKRDLSSREKEKLVDSMALASVGVGLGALGLYTAGVIPKAALLPFFIASLSIRGGKEVVKYFINKKEHNEFAREVKQFDNMNITDKLNYVNNLEESKKYNI